MSDDSDPPADSGPAFVATSVDDVCRFRRADGPATYLSTGFDGGVRVADAAYNLTVPEGWGDAGPRDLGAYVADRIAAAGFEATPDTPALLTGVAQRHAHLARLDGVTALATAGISNPAALPVSEPERRAASAASETTDDGPPRPGTVNVLVGVDRTLDPGALANLVAVVAEAKATTLLAVAGVPGTTSDAVVVGCPPGYEDGGDPAAFSGSATPVGAATRVCVRDAVHASLRSRYGADLDGLPDSVADAEYGVVSDERATVSRVR